MPESTLLKSLHFGKEDEWLAKFYSCLIKKHDKETSVEDTFSELERNSCSFSSSDSSFSQTLKNSDLLACKAEYYHQCGEYQKCFDATSALLARDPYHLKFILVHLAAAVELGHSNDLYLMSCNLVKDYPYKALAWFAVGCYYYCTNKYDQARRYFCKATSVDGTFPPAYQESDQALSAYGVAARLFPGSRLICVRIYLPGMYAHVDSCAHTREAGRDAFWNCSWVDMKRSGVHMSSMCMIQGSCGEREQALLMRTSFRVQEICDNQPD